MRLEAPTVGAGSATDCVQAETKSAGTRVKGRCHYACARSGPWQFGYLGSSSCLSPAAGKIQNSGKWGLSCWHIPPCLPGAQFSVCLRMWRSVHLMPALSSHRVLARGRAVQVAGWHAGPKLSSASGPNNGFSKEAAFSPGHTEVSTWGICLTKGPDSGAARTAENEPQPEEGALDPTADHGAPTHVAPSPSERCALRLAPWLPGTCWESEPPMSKVTEHKASNGPRVLVRPPTRLLVCLTGSPVRWKGLDHSHALGHGIEHGKAPDLQTEAQL